MRVLPWSESKDLLVSYLPAALVIKLQEVGLQLLEREDRNGDRSVQYLVPSAESLLRLRSLFFLETEQRESHPDIVSEAPEQSKGRAGLIIDALEKAWRADETTLERSLAPILELPCPVAGQDTANALLSECEGPELMPRSSGVSLTCLMLSVPTVRMGVARCLLQEALERDLHSSDTPAVATSSSSLSERCVGELRWLHSSISPIRMLPALAPQEAASIHAYEHHTIDDIADFMESILGALGVASPALQVALLETLPELMQTVSDLSRYELALARALPGLLEGAIRCETDQHRLLNTIIDSANTIQTTQAREIVLKSLLDQILGLVPTIHSANSLATALQFLIGALEMLKVPNGNDGADLIPSDPSESKSTTANAIIEAIRGNLLTNQESPQDAAIVISAVTYALHHARHAVEWMLLWYREGADLMEGAASAISPESLHVARNPQFADLLLFLALFRASPERFVRRTSRTTGSNSRCRYPAVVDAAATYLLRRDNGREALRRWGFVLSNHDGTALLELINQTCMPPVGTALQKCCRIETVARLLAALFRAVRSVRQTCLLNLLEHVHSDSEHRRLFALSTFECIAEEAPHELAAVASLVHGLVELCETLAPPEWRYSFGRGDLLNLGTRSGLGTPGALQLTLVYRSIGLMHRTVSQDAHRTSDNNQSMDSFVPLLVRKLVTHVDVLHQRCGCMAAAICIRTWSENAADHPRAIELLELSLQCTERRALVAAQLYAELYAAMTTERSFRGGDSNSMPIGRSAPAKWLLAHALRRFAAQFIWMYQGDSGSQEDTSPNKPRYAITSADTAELLLPLASIAESGQEDAQSLASMMPLFCLIWSLGLAQYGYESEWFRNELWPLLGAAMLLPLSLFATCTVSATSDRGRHERLCLVTALNWLRAQVHCLTVLVQQGSERARMYLRQRLEHLAEMDDMWRRTARLSASGSRFDDPLLYRFPASIVSWLLAETAAEPESNALCWVLRELGHCDGTVIEESVEQLIRIAAMSMKPGTSSIAVEALRVLGQAPRIDVELLCREVVPRLPQSSCSETEADGLWSCFIPMITRFESVSLAQAESLHRWLRCLVFERPADDSRLMQAVLYATMHLVQKVSDATSSATALEWAVTTLEIYLPAAHVCERQAHVCVACQLDAHPRWLATIAEAIGQRFRDWCLDQAPSGTGIRERSVARVVATVHPDHFAIFGRFAQLLKRLLDRAVQTRDRRALAASMRLGRTFADHMNRHLVPFWMTQFSTHAGPIASSCALLQKSTRILQRLCAYAKEQRDRSLAAQTPPLKKALELFVYRVKGMLSANASLSSFWMGTLRHKNLEGEIVGSQLQNGSDSSDSGDSTAASTTPIRSHTRAASSTTVTSRSGSQQER
jgi:hypothetical protein